MYLVQGIHARSRLVLVSCALLSLAAAGATAAPATPAAPAPTDPARPALSVVVTQPISIGPAQQRGTTTLFITAPKASEAAKGGAPAVPAATSAGAPASGTPAAPPALQIIPSAGALLDKTSKAPLPGRLSFKPESLTIAPGATETLTVTAEDVVFEGEAEVAISNQGQPFSSITVTRAPLSLTLSEASVFKPGEHATLKLSNASHHALPIRWMLQIGAARYCGEKSAAPEGGKDAAGRSVEASKGGGAPKTDAPGRSAEPVKGSTVGDLLGWAAPKHAIEPPDCGDPSRWPLVNIPAKGIEPVDFVVPAESPWFQADLLASFSELNQKASLWLDLGGTLAKRELTFDARLQGKHYPGESLWILLFLVLGAVFSLLVRHSVPNLQRKRELKERVRQVRARISAFSSLVPSNLRTQAREQATLAKVLLNSSLPVLPDYATVAAQCAAALTTLEKRVELISEMDAVREKLGCYWDKSPPPTQVDLVDAQLEIASDGLAKAYPLESDLLAIRAALDNAKAIVGQMGKSTSAFATALGERAKAAKLEAAALKASAVKHGLANEVGALFEIVDSICPDPTAPIRMECQSQLDYTLRALDVWRDYLWLARGAGAPAPNKLTELRESMKAHLAQERLNEFYLAERELRQYREHVTPEDVEVEVAKGSVDIAYEPREFTYPQVVDFRLRFDRDELNWSAARSAVSPDWAFESGGGIQDWSWRARKRKAQTDENSAPAASAGASPEHTPTLRPRAERDAWQVSYLFEERRSWLERLGDFLFGGWLVSERHERVSVRFRTQGAPADPGAESLATKTLTIPVRRRSFLEKFSRSWVEILSLAIAIAIPLVSLIAGAKEQLSKDPASGALVVFLLGFGADAVISVFRQRSGATA